MMVRYTRFPAGPLLRSLVFSTAALAVVSLFSPTSFGQSSTLQRSASEGDGASLPPESFSSSVRAEDAATELPEAPTPQRYTSGKPLPPAGSSEREVLAPRTADVIFAGQRASQQTVRDKEDLGLVQLYNAEGFAAMVVSAGYEQVTNGQPNYGTDKGAFGQRLGAAALREKSQGVFEFMVFAPLLHEDARYYVEGPSFNAVHRTLYAISRTLITRNDAGRNTVNGALLLGYAASAGLTPAYYPSANRTFRDVFSVYGGSLGGSALGFFVNEFTDDALIFVHLKHKPRF